MYIYVSLLTDTVVCEKWKKKMFILQTEFIQDNYKYIQIQSKKNTREKKHFSSR